MKREKPEHVSGYGTFSYYCEHPGARPKVHKGALPFLLPATSAAPPPSADSRSPRLLGFRRGWQPERGEILFYRGSGRQKSVISSPQGPLQLRHREELGL